MDLTYDFPLRDIPKSANLSIYAASAEENNKPPLLLIHGFLSSRAQWLDNLDEMQKFCRPIVIEHFGHGRTAAPQEESNCTLNVLIMQLERLRAYLGIEKWAVCGHSMGGAISLNYAAYHPEAISAVVFSNAVSAFQDTRAIDMRAEIDQFASTIEEGGQKALEATPYHPNLIKHASPQVRNALVSDAKLINPGGLARALRGTNADISIRYRVSEVLCPKLLINGVREKAFQPDRDWAEAHISALTIFDLADTGHSPNAERPEQFNKAIEEFLNTHWD